MTDPNDKPGFLVIVLPFSADGTAQTAALQVVEAQGYTKIESVYTDSGLTFAIVSRGYYQ